MALNGLQVSGFSLGVLSWAGMIGTCISPEWRKYTEGQTIIDSTLRYDGLWVRCKAFATGQTHCQDYYPFYIGFQSELQICRALMISSIVLGLIAIFVTVWGLKCVTIGPKTPAVKARVALCGGLLFGVAGVLTGAAVSFFAHTGVQQYYNPTLPQALPMHLRYEYGYGLFIGWACLVGSLLCTVMLVVVSVVTFNQRPAGPEANKHNFRPVSILQKMPQTENIPLQTHNTSLNPAPSQRQVRIHQNIEARKSDYLHPNGSHKSFQNSFASSSVRSGPDERRRRMDRERLNSEKSVRSRSNGKTAADVHIYREKNNRRRSGDETPPRGLVRSVSGSLKQYL